MIKLNEYDGYIKNWKKLCGILNISPALQRPEREKRIIVNGYKKWGEDLPKYLKGCFSFCIRDESRNIHFCARDIFGVIPLYYWNDMHSEFICSTIIDKIFKTHKEKILNEKALQMFMTFSYLPGEETFFKNIYKLMPGCALVEKKGAINIKKYLDVFNPSHEEYSMDEAIDKLNIAISKTISETCASENNTEAFLLSGGLDSNYLYAISNVNKAYSVGFREADYDESIIAATNSMQLGRNCERVFVDPELFFNSVKDGMKRLEQPLGTAASIAFMLGCKAAAESVDILYTGEGADELFAGYDSYNNAARYDNGCIYTGKAEIFTEQEKKKLLLNYDDRYTPVDMVKKYAPREKNMSSLKYMMYVDRKLWLEGNSFLNSYKMSRGFGLEIRMPFIDEDVFRVVASIPDAFIIDEKQNKKILRKLAESVLTKEMAQMPKKGFVTPIRYWLADAKYNKDVREKFNSSVAKRFFKADEIRNLLEEYCNGHYDLWRKVWLIYTFLVWYNVNFKETG